METTDFEDVLREAASEAGVDAENISTTEFLTWRRFAKRRLEVAWRYHYWPDLEQVEQRFYRDAYNPSLTYAQAIAGVDNFANEVYWPLTGQYFVALTTVPGATPPTDANGVVDAAHWAVTQQFAIQPDPAGTQYSQPVANVLPFDLTVTYNQGDRAQYAANVYQLFAATATGVLPTDGTQWGLIPPFEPTVLYAQTGQTPMGIVEECFSANPNTTTRGNTLDWKLTEKGVNVMTRIAYAWIQFRRQCPKLNGTVLDPSATYAAGQQVYFSSATTPGNFYTALALTTAGQTPDNTPTSWTVIELPRIFHRYLVLGMAADWQKYVVGTNPEAEPQAQLAQAMAEEELQETKSTFVGQMGQRTKTQIRTR